MQLRTVLPSAGLKQHSSTQSVWPMNVRMHAPVATDQSFSSVLSPLPETTVAPSALYAQQLTISALRAARSPSRWVCDEAALWDVTSERRSSTPQPANGQVVVTTPRSPRAPPRHQG